MTVDVRTRVADRGRVAALVTGLLLAPFVAMLHLELSYADVRHACRQGSELRLHVTSAVLLLAALAGAAVAWRMLQGSSDRGAPGDPEIAAANTRFVAVTGVLVSLYFSLVIVAQWLAVFMLGPCQ
ncbi:MAG TPA: hypothetical protein VFK09_11980 [Gemmatimonadales bacterium]|nr:hypothetical protein [Gemmatimonadales bacterium]